MLTRDYRDVFAGVFIFSIGGCAALHAYASYNMGTVTRMGPGMFPAALGCILVAFGIALTVGGLFRPGTIPEIRIISPIFILGAVAAFALVITPLGLLPAVIASTVVSSFAERDFRPIGLAVMCLVLCTMAWTIFILGLGLSIPLLNWP